MRECEIDLVAEHRLASSTGLAPADALLGPGVSGARALPGKALIYLLPLSQRRRLTLTVSASVRAPCSDHSPQVWTTRESNQRERLCRSGNKQEDRCGSEWSSMRAVRCLVVAECLSGISCKVCISMTSSFVPQVGQKGNVIACSIVPGEFVVLLEPLSTI